ncbi:hypothetical protein [Dendronalium sp. ChiSLP03b]|uniref:hypothetical protein n=1 Tax=Dendronalium sp. ChiSLP03b TaxID=3075381 RepID=UPI002AD4428C|nr:hypothetical protein [Dendronalium sp. ChiSLP03b]MDZ8203764.1 hypothetical protein [Dendronalium sp. ChiSLP03b]
MAKLVSSESKTIGVNKLFHDLTPIEMATASGGSDLTLTNIQDGVNNKSEKSSLYSIEGNKLFTIDFSGLTMNFIFLIDIL